MPTQLDPTKTHREYSWESRKLDDGTYEAWSTELNLNVRALNPDALYNAMEAAYQDKLKTEYTCPQT